MKWRHLERSQRAVRYSLAEKSSLVFFLGPDYDVFTVYGRFFAFLTRFVI